MAQRRLAQIAELRRGHAAPAPAGFRAGRPGRRSSAFTRETWWCVGFSTDSARRLIRAVRADERSRITAMVEEYLAANPQLFERPAQLRITHVAVDGFKWPSGTKGGPRRCWIGFSAGGIAPEQATSPGRRVVHAGDASAPHAQGPPDEVRHEVRRGVAGSPRGRGSGPLPSRLRLPPGVGARTQAGIRCRRSRRSVRWWTSASCKSSPTNGWRSACSSCGLSSTSSCRRQVDDGRFHGCPLVDAVAAPDRHATPRPAARRPPVRSRPARGERDLTPGRAAVRWKQPLVQVQGSRLRPILPGECQGVGKPSVVRAGQGVVASWEIMCPGGLVDKTLGVEDIATSGADVLLRVTLPDGRSIRQSADRRPADVPRAERREQAAGPPGLHAARCRSHSHRVGSPGVRPGAWCC